MKQNTQKTISTDTTQQTRKFRSLKDLLYDYYRSCSRPHGKLGRFNLRMMNLFHTPRSRWYLSLIPFQRDWTVLDIGCGGGKNIARMLRRCPEGKVYGLDRSEESVRLSQKTNQKHIGTRCFISQGTADNLPFEDRMFDLVTAYETVFFWQDLPKAFSEVYRVLKKGGMFTFSYGVAGNKTLERWSDIVDDMYFLPQDEITRFLTDAGFQNILTVEKSGTSINFRAYKV